MSNSRPGSLPLAHHHQQHPLPHHQPSLQHENDDGTPNPKSLKSKHDPSSASSTPSKPAKPKNPKKYRCTYCDRAFTRSEHRSRHERSHTKEKPFHCEKCPSAFVRRDLLLRHDRTVHAVRNGGQGPENSNATAPPQAPVSPAVSTAAKKDGKPKEPKPKANGKENKRKRSSLSSEQKHNNVDVDFNAAVLMTELQHSFHKQSPHTNSAKPPPSPPPQQDYLPPLNFQNHHGTSALDLSSNSSSSHQSSSNGANANSGHSGKRGGGGGGGPPGGSPQLVNAAGPGASGGGPNGATNSSAGAAGNGPSASGGGGLHGNSNTTSGGGGGGGGGPLFSPHFNQSAVYSPTNFLNPIRDPNSNYPHQQHNQNQQQQFFSQGQPPPPSGGVNYEHPVHIPQFDSNFHIGSLLKFFSEPDKSMAQQPTRVQLNRYMSAYFTFFHPQLPFLHPPTFDPPNTAPSLIFGVCAIGAVLCHETTMASSLHSTSRMLVSSIYEVDKDFPNTRNTPLWATQSLIFSLVYSSWSGDPRGLEFISTVRTSLANIASTAFYEHCTNDNNDSSQQHWKKWLTEESAKRTFFAVYTVFGSLAAVYNYPTALSNSDVPMKIQLPCSEVLWNSTFGSENEWMYQYMRETNNTCNHLLFSQALGSLTNEQPQSLPPLSPFGVRVLSTALFVDLLGPQSSSFSRDKSLAVVKAWDVVAKDSHPGQGQMVTQIALNSTFVCLSLPMEDHMNFLFNGPSPLLSRIRTQHPLLISAYISSLVTQVRLLVDLTSVQEVIRYHVPSDICNAALSSYTVLSTTGRLRMPQLTGLVAKCFDLFRLPCLLGLRLMKTVLASPLVASNIECVLCNFELSLVLIMWCHRVEQDVSNGESLDEDEALLYSVLERTCFDCGLDKVQGHLAPSLALFGADLLESIETWGLANILSLSLRSFGYALFPQQTRMRHSPPSGQPSNVAPLAANTTNPQGFASYQQSNMRTTSSERDMFNLPFKAMT